MPKLLIETTIACFESSFVDTKLWGIHDCTCKSIMLGMTNLWNDSSDLLRQANGLTRSRNPWLVQVAGSGDAVRTVL